MSSTIEQLVKRAKSRDYRIEYAITCVVPVYNGEKYLRECIDSVVAQTYSNWELILVDDGSTDGSGTICDEYAARDPRITVIHQANAGVSAARNAGIAAAKGLYTIFVDADDMLHPDCMSLMIEVRDRHSEFIHGLEYTLNTVIGCEMAKGAGQPQWEATPDLKGHVKAYDEYEAIAKTLYQRRLNCSCSGKMFMTRKLREDGGFREGIRYEDLEAITRFYTNTLSDMHICIPLYFYRDNPTSYINTWSWERMDVLTVTEDIEQRYANNEPALARAARARRFCANYNIMLLCMRHGQDDQARQCWRVIRSHRLGVLTNRRTRLKDKMGALVSFLGYRMVKLLFGRPKKA